MIIVIYYNFLVVEYMKRQSDIILLFVCVCVCVCVLELFWAIVIVKGNFYCR